MGMPLKLTWWSSCPMAGSGPSLKLTQALPYLTLTLIFIKRPMLCSKYKDDRGNYFLSAPDAQRGHRLHTMLKHLVPKAPAVTGGNPFPVTTEFHLDASYSLPTVSVDCSLWQKNK